MRTIFPLMIAVALTAAAPAVAQGTDNAADANAVTAPAGDQAVVVDNAVVTDPAMTADPANDLAGVPVATDEPVDMTYGEPAPAKKSGFPWGVLGLLGLLGLMPRKARG